MSWDMIALLAGCTYLLKLAGLVLHDRPLPPLVRRAGDLLPGPLLAGLVAVNTLERGEQLVVDERAVGLALAAVAAALRAPVAVVILVGTVATAVTRLVW